MKARSLLAKTTLLLVLAALIATTAFAAPGDAQDKILVTYEVTITNVTASQIFSPPVLVTHKARTGVFHAGEAASDEVAMVAEDGDASALVALLEADPDVHDIVVADGPLMPGSSVTMEIEAGNGAWRLSALGMLVTTNDAFFGLDSYRLTTGRRASKVSVPAYDAGTETNNESCDFIPGPPCGNPGVRDTSAAEGFVHVHRGIYGVGDLDPSGSDWRNPVANIMIDWK